MLTIVQIDWSARWKVVLWPSWLRWQSKVDLEEKCWLGPVREWLQPGIGHGSRSISYPFECTAAASSGRIFGGGGVNYSSDYQFDDCLAKNPIDTELRPFDELDVQFEKEKEVLLRRYQGRNSNATRHTMESPRTRSALPELPVHGMMSVK